MPMHRSNKATAIKADSEHEPWFFANRIRQRRRNEISRKSRRVQRRLAKGKR